MPKSTPFTWISGVETATLYSPYSPIECADRMRDRLDREEFDGLIGGVNPDSLWLRQRPGRTEARSTWFTMLSAIMRSDDQGTRIDCHLGLWRGTIFVVAGFLLLTGVTGTRFAMEDPTAVPVLLGFSLLVVATHLVAGSVARRNGRILLRYLSTMVEASEGGIDRQSAIEDLWRNG